MATRTAAAAPGLTDRDLRGMLDRAIKLTAENKITKDNSWDWDFINVMPDIIKNEAAEKEFNFQRASCGLDAGVKIYSKRVDSTYETVYQSMQGMMGITGPLPIDEDGDGEEGSQAGMGAGAGTQPSKRAAAGVKDTDPEKTLEPEKDLLAVQAASTFETDPLFRRTTKLFDENCPSGLLMLNFPVYHRSQILSDSEESPLAKFPKGRDQLAGNRRQRVDLRTLAPLVQQLLIAVGDAHITPSVTSLHPPSVAAHAQQEVDLGALLAAWAPAAGVHDLGPVGGEEAEQGGDTGRQGGDGDVYADLGGGLDAGGDDGFDAFAGGMGNEDADVQGYSNGSMGAGEEQQEGGGSAFDFTSLRNGLVGLGISPGTAAASGAAFWKYKPKPAVAAAKGGAEKAKTVRRRKEQVALNFASEVDVSEEMLEQGTRAQLCLKRTSAASKVVPPQDTQYTPHHLYQLSLNPSVDAVKVWHTHLSAAAKVVSGAGRRGQGPAASGQGSWQDEGSAFGGLEDDGEDMMGGGDLGGYDGGEEEEVEAGGQVGFGAAADPLSITQLLPKPRKVERVDIKYDKSAKQVDVKALKEAIRDSMSGLVPHAPHAAHGKLQGKALAFQEVITSLPASKDLSVHLCFICLLHLANESGLALSNQGQLDQLDVLVPGA